MNEQNTTAASASSLKALDRIVTAFDQAWKKGSEPSIEAYLLESPQGINEEVFQSLLRIDLNCRLLKPGKMLPVENYRVRFPLHAAVINAIYFEVVNPSTTRDMAEEWFYLRNRLPVGPFAFDQLKNLALSGDLRPKDLVNRKGTAEWLEAGTVAGLFSGRQDSKELKQPAPGQWIREDYVLLELVGRGGMGEVYKAYRFALKKEVALKIIRFDRFQKLSPPQQAQVLQDFQKEMQATANMRHDHIVNIFDTGDLNGLPFYTMDLVDTNLAKLLHFGPMPGRKAAEHLAKVAQAVDHANQRGLVHRDIKPHNVLVSAGKPILADLGLAAVRERLQEGQEDGHVVGTPPYMAPEQAQGAKVDHRADVYGLGATLYHLITGRPPHQATEKKETLRQVVHVEPLAPRKLNPAIDRDLEAITMKCLEKMPERRYQSAGLLAEDLDRYLQGKPVLAKKPTPWDRLYKWARREPLKAGLLSGILFLILVLFIGSAWSNRRLSAALITAQQERDRATAKSEEAESERKKAVDIGNILGTRVLNKYKHHENLDGAIEELKMHGQATEQVLKKTPLENINLDLAETYRTLANLYLQKNQDKEAAASLEKCIHFQEELGKGDLGKKFPIIKLELALNNQDLGTIFGRLRVRGKELKCDLRGLAILQELQGQGFNNPLILSSLAEAHGLVAIDWANKGEPDKTLKHRKEALQILEELAASSKEKDDLSFNSLQKQLGIAYQDLGKSLTTKNPAEALVYFGKAKGMLEGKSLYRRNLAGVIHGTARAFLSMANSEKAIKAVEDALALINELLKEHPPNSFQADSLLQEKAEIVSTQAKAYQQMEKYETAEELFLLSLNLRKELALRPGFESSPVNGYLNLTAYYMATKKYPEAIRSLDQAIPIQTNFVRKAPQDPPPLADLGLLFYQKGLIHYQIQKDEEALVFLEIAKKHETAAFRFSDNGKFYGKNLNVTFRLIFQVQQRLKKYEEAVKTIVEERTTLWPNDPDKYRESAQDLAAVYARDRSPKTLAPILTFMDQAITKKMLTLGEIQGNTRFQELRSTPGFLLLEQRHEK